MRARARFFPDNGIACSTESDSSVKAFGAMLTKRAVRDIALTRRSSQAASCVMRFFFAFHFASASLIDGLLATTVAVTSFNERGRETTPELRCLSLGSARDSET